MRRRIILLVVVVAGVLFGGAGVIALTAATDLRAARADLTVAKERTRALEVDAASRALASAEQLIARARRRLGLFPLRVVASTPLLGRSVRAVDAIAEAAAVVVDGAEAALSVADELPSDDGFRLSGGRFPRVDWSRIERRARSAADAFARAQRIARDAPIALVPGPIVRARAELLDEVQDARRAAEGLAIGARILPGLLGEKGPRHHLVVIQNLAEQRATGGAIEALMLLRTDGGSFDLVRADGDEEVLGLPGDASAGHALNLDPHLPDVALRIAARYRRSTGIRADTVIALDAIAIERILSATGGVTVDGRTLDGDNAASFLSEDIFRHYPSEESQSVFLGAVTAAAWSELTGDQVSVPRLVEQLGAAARTKHVMLWSRDQDEQAALRALEIAGVFPAPAPGGALLAVIGNQATPAELDAFARRRVNLRVELAADGTATSRLRVAVRHTARLNQIPPLLFQKSPGGVLRSDLTAWVGDAPSTARLLVRPGDEESHTFRGVTRTSPGEYRLVWFRQPSLQPDTVDLEVVIPEGARVLEAPDGAEVAGRIIRWQGTPETDLELVVRYR